MQPKLNPYKKFSISMILLLIIVLFASIMIAYYREKKRNDEIERKYAREKDCYKFVKEIAIELDKKIDNNIINTVSSDSITMYLTKEVFNVILNKGLQDKIFHLCEDAKEVTVFVGSVLRETSKITYLEEKIKKQLEVQEIRKGIAAPTINLVDSLTLGVENKIKEFLIQEFEYIVN